MSWFAAIAAARDGPSLRFEIIIRHQKKVIISIILMSALWKNVYNAKKKQMIYMVIFNMVNLFAQNVMMKMYVVVVRDLIL